MPHFAYFVRHEMDPLRYSNFKQLSPHIMVDPSLLQKQAQEFIMDQEMTRGKLENSITAICTNFFGSVLGINNPEWHRT